MFKTLLIKSILMVFIAYPLPFFLHQSLQRLVLFEKTKGWLIITCLVKERSKANQAPLILLLNQTRKREKDASYHTHISKRRCQIFSQVYHSEAHSFFLFFLFFLSLPHFSSKFYILVFRRIFINLKYFTFKALALNTYIYWDTR